MKAYKLPGAAPEKRGTQRTSPRRASLLCTRTSKWSGVKKRRETAWNCFRAAACAAILAATSAAADRVPAGPPANTSKQIETCQVATLRNGFTISFTRQEVNGTNTRLWVCAGTGASGFLELPTEQIESVEQAPAPPPAASYPPPTNTLRTTPAANSIQELIAKAASRYRIDADFVSSVIKAESGFNPVAVSPKGAVGLMQLMPRTAAGLGVGSALDPVANVNGGTKYLRALLDQYDGDAVKALAAYNAGPKRVEQYSGVPPFPETYAYVTRVINDYNRRKLRQQVQKNAAEK